MKYVYMSLYPNLCWDLLSYTSVYRSPWTIINLITYIEVVFYYLTLFYIYFFSFCIKYVANDFFFYVQLQTTYYYTIAIPITHTSLFSLTLILSLVSFFLQRALFDLQLIFRVSQRIYLVSEQQTANAIFRYERFVRLCLMFIVKENCNSNTSNRKEMKRISAREIFFFTSLRYTKN